MKIRHLKNKGFGNGFIILIVRGEKKKVMLNRLQWCVTPGESSHRLYGIGPWDGRPRFLAVPSIHSTVLGSEPLTTKNSASNPLMPFPLCELLSPGLKPWTLLTSSPAERLASAALPSCPQHKSFMVRFFNTPASEVKFFCCWFTHLSAPRGVCLCGNEYPGARPSRCSNAWLGWAAAPGDREPSPELNVGNKPLGNSAYPDLAKKGHIMDILLEIAEQSHRSATALNSRVLGKG